MYIPANRCAKNGVLEQVPAALQESDIINIHVIHVSPDSTAVKVNPDGTGALKGGEQSIGKSRRGWVTEIHMIATDARTAVAFSSLPGIAGISPQGRERLKTLEIPGRGGTHVIMDKACDGNETQPLVLVMVPVMPQKAIV